MEETTTQNNGLVNQTETSASSQSTDIERLRADTFELVQMTIIAAKEKMTVPNFTCVVRAISAFKTADDMVRKQAPKQSVDKNIPPEVIRQIEREVLGINRDQV